MGAGNTIIRHDGTSYNTYYLEHYSHSDDNDKPYCDDNPCICNEYFIDDLTGNISSFKNLVKAYKRYIPDCRVIAENSILMVVIADNEWSTAIACIPILNDNYNYNHGAFIASANSVMKKVAEMQSIYARNGAWQSSVIEDAKNYVFY
jgi:hypothetical protein